MTLKNLTRKTIITKDLKEAKSFLDQLLGLNRQSNPKSLLFKTRFGIHTFGLKEEIDMLVLDQNWRVVKLATIKPGNFFFWNPKYEIVIELSRGSIKKSKTNLGDIMLSLSL